MPHILLVDDDKITRQVIGSMLEDAGYEVTLAVDGWEAISFHHTGRFDLVITDLLMPDKDGIETILELQKSEPDLKIIAMSCGTYDNLKVAKALGATEILPKPFSSQQLTEMVLQVLERH